MNMLYETLGPKLLEIVNEQKKRMLKDYAAGDFQTLLSSISKDADKTISEIYSTQTQLDISDLELYILEIAAKELIQSGYKVYRVVQWSDYAGGTLRYNFFTCNKQFAVDAITETIEAKIDDGDIPAEQKEIELKKICCYGVK